MLSPQRDRYDALVIGAGHNGLTAAAYLARAGLSVLAVERRETAGGCCVTEEIAPGCRASTTSYIASMLRPTVVRDLQLKRHGLRMVPCDPFLQIALPEGRVVPWWADPKRRKDELRSHSPADAETFFQVDEELKRLARFFQPFFLKPPPDLNARGINRWKEIFRAGKHFRSISGSEISSLISFMTGSLGEFLDRHYESEIVKRLILANNVYGMHGGPYHPGTCFGLLFHLLGGGEKEEQGFYGHVLGGMGSITQALAAAAREYGAEIMTSAPVARIEVRGGRARGVVLEDGREIRGRVILSNADPKRTFLAMVDPAELPAQFVKAVRGIKMEGPCAKVNLVLSEEPSFRGTPANADPQQRSLFTLVPTLEGAENCYHAAKFGNIPEDIWVDCVVASNVDPSLVPPGRHIMTCFVQYVPYRLREGCWDQKREWLGDRVVKKIAEYAPSVPSAIVARQVLTPLDLERTYGLTEGNIFHGDLNLEQLFFMRPVPGWAQYRTPVRGLYLCGAGAHPGGGVTAAPGHNAAHQVLRDLRRGKIRD
ncbi:MAG: phytoene desaturase family protein [Terriglobia bacterium]